MTNEGAKLAHETFKHLTTLSSGGILVFATFLVRPEVRNDRVAIAGIGCFLISNIVSIFLMFKLAKWSNDPLTASDRVMSLGQMLALLFFNLGLLCAAGFASSNFL